MEKKNIWSWVKKAMTIAGFAVVCAIFGTLAAPQTQLAKSAETVMPRFNYLNGDYDMLRGAHLSDQSWTDPINANIGDRVAVMFYYHNGVLGSVANHTTLRVDLPVAESTSLKLTSYLWSQQTAPISDTVVSGNIVGNSGLTINLPTAGRVEYVPGSTKWFPNGAQVGTPVAGGIVSSSGLDIGDIKGCWNYAGFVTFMVDIKGQAALKMDKKVAHVGDSAWQDEAIAMAGDELNYSLGIRNDGNDVAQNVTVKDILPAQMSYVPGSTYVFTKDNMTGTKVSDAIFADGITLPNILNGQDNIVFVRYRVKVSATIPNTMCGWYLNNVARVYMNGVEQDMDQAKVTVRCESRILSIDKKVWNGTAFVEQNNAKLGDTVSYRVSIKNLGNTTITNIKMHDVMPINMKYVIGSAKINGTSVSDALVTTGGINAGSLAAGAEMVVTLRGVIDGCLPVGVYTLQNAIYVSADSITEQWDIATTITNATSIVVPVVQ
ncbi:MAG: hypothetical protein WCG48_00890 [Candidatus Berkelbacteria bacterium]